MKEGKGGKQRKKDIKKDGNKELGQFISGLGLVIFLFSYFFKDETDFGLLVDQHLSVVVVGVVHDGETGKTLLTASMSQLITID